MTSHRPAHRRPSFQLAALAALLCCTLLAGVAAAEGTPAGASSKDKTQAAHKMEFDKYYLVILRRGPAWTPEETPETQRIQKEHLAHLGRMGETGKLLVAGPFDEQQDPTFRGMCLYRTDTLEEARKLAEQDPAVKAGRLKVEAMAWYMEKGALAFPKAKPAK